MKIARIVLWVASWVVCGCAGADMPGTSSEPAAQQPSAAGGGASPSLGQAGAAGAAVEPPSQTVTGAAGTVAPPSAASGAAGAAGTPAMMEPVAMEPQIPRPQGWGEATHARGATPDYARLFADDRVHRIDIEMPAASMEAMYADLDKLLGDSMQGQGGFPFPGGGAPGQMGGMMRDPLDLIGGEPIYVPVTVRYEGGVWTQVGMRFKGNSSLATAYRRGIKKIGFRLDFDRYEDEFPETTDQRFYGFGKMTFSSGYNDPSLIRDKLAADVLEGLGLVSARCAFYQIYVDGGSGPQYWGLYTMIEDPADQLIEAQFTDKSGNLYKPDGPGADFKTFDKSGFEKKSNEEAEDFSDVMRAVSALNAPRGDAAAWRAGLDAVFNVQSFLDVLAISRAIGHWDGYGIMAHNYYLYGDPSDGGRLAWISWDHNLSWQPGGGFFGSLTVMMDEITEEWPLIRYVMDDPVYRAQYLKSLEAALVGPYEKAAFDARATQLHTLIAPYVLGQNGAMGETMPFTFIEDPAQFRDALSSPERGLLPTADMLRQSVVSALAE
jgi:spore coat protein H